MGIVRLTIGRIRFAWGRFLELLSLLTNQEIPLKSRGKVYSSCIPSVMLYGSECWALTTVDAKRLQRNERAMIHWICNVKISAQKMKFSIKDLFSKCDQIRNVTNRIWSRLLRKYLMENFISCAVILGIGIYVGT